MCLSVRGRSGVGSGAGEGLSWRRRHPGEEAQRVKEERRGVCVRVCVCVCVEQGVTEPPQQLKGPGD